MRRLLIVPLVVLLATVLAVPASAGSAFPEVIPLPDGFQPEGIEIGPGTTFYVGSIPTGAIYRGDLRTGEGDVWIAGGQARQAIGLDLDPAGRWLWVAGGPTSEGYVYHTSSSAGPRYTYDFNNSPTFVNDVVVTKGGAYFTDSQQAVIYRVALGAGFEPTGDFTEIPLGGDYTHVTGAFNLNGIEATANGKWLVAVQSVTGSLFRINPETGEATLIDLDGAVMTAGDGLLLHGKTLYVVQNRLNQIAVVELSPDLTSGAVVDTITSPYFDVPTTIADYGNRLYAVNARFGTTDPQPAAYDVVRVTKH